MIHNAGRPLMKTKFDKTYQIFTYIIFLIQTGLVLLTGKWTWWVIHLSGAARAQDLMVLFPLILFGLPLSLFQFFFMLIAFGQDTQDRLKKRIWIITVSNQLLPIIVYFICTYIIENFYL